MLDWAHGSVQSVPVCEALCLTLSIRRKTILGQPVHLLSVWQVFVLISLPLFF